jgi:hypothetical protein
MGELKLTKKIVYEISRKDDASKRDEKLLELIKIAGEIVIREDEQLLRELAKY